MKIALLHPQCRVQWGAIKMALLAAHSLQEQWHEVVLYTFDYSVECFSDLQKNLTLVEWKKRGITRFFLPGKLFRIISLAFHVRHVDTVIANNPPMQIVAALAKIFSFQILRSVLMLPKDRSRPVTIWWHHHTPWYMEQASVSLRIKSFLERRCVIPFIDQMVATSHFVAGQLKEYCGREAQVVHPIVTEASPPFKGTRSEQISLRETQEAEVSQQSQSQYPNFPLETSSPLKGALDMVTLFTHGRLEPGKGLDTIVRVWKRLRLVNPGVGAAVTPGLLIAGSGSLADWLREQGAEVIEFNPGVWETLTPGLTIGVYASTIDAFGLAPLEAQIAGLPTVILDRGGARETILTDMSGKPVGHLVHSEEAIYASLCHYLEHKLFPKPVSIVNFFHTIEHFTTSSLDQDMLILMSKTR